MDERYTWNGVSFGSKTKDNDENMLNLKYGPSKEFSTKFEKMDCFESWFTITNRWKQGIFPHLHEVEAKLKNE